jgi:deazaflavin-dependent oxidoreductase (nitroreductase family)
MAGAAAEDFNHRIIEEFRANGGRVGGSLAGTPLLLLRHIGARSGIERVTPLAYRPHGDGRYLIVASNGGSPTHPGWYHNLKANPAVEVEVGTETFTACAEELEAAAHHPLLSELVAASASLREHQTKTARRIPMLMLTRGPSTAASAARRTGEDAGCRRTR